MFPSTMYLTFSLGPASGVGLCSTPGSTPGASWTPEGGLPGWGTAGASPHTAPALEASPRALDHPHPGSEHRCPVAGFPQGCRVSSVLLAAWLTWSLICLCCHEALSLCLPLGVQFAPSVRMLSCESRTTSFSSASAQLEELHQDGARLQRVGFWGRTLASSVVL